MSGQAVSTDLSHPPHGHPENRGATTQSTDKSRYCGPCRQSRALRSSLLTHSTASHPASFKPDPTLSVTGSTPGPAAPAAATTSPASGDSQELSALQSKLKGALRQYPDFPSPGILFEDIMPIFADASLHEALLHAIELHLTRAFGAAQKPDVVVGLEARGFLFGPALALRLGAGFVPVRKRGKLPGQCETAAYDKEYGQDFFQVQHDAIKQGQRVVVVDDIIATGGSAAAAGELVRRLGGTLLGYVFMLELDFLKGRDKLDAPVYTLLSSQEEKS